MESSGEPLICFRNISMEHLDRVEELESIGFPADEAASRATMAFRLQNAATYTVGTWLRPTSSLTSENSVHEAQKDSKNLIGYVVGTCSSTVRLEHESMFNHDPNGTHLCVHSVLTEEKYQGKGFAKLALFNYVQHIKKNAPHITKISLLAKASKMRLYQGCGFRLIGVSPVVHGQEEWNELTMDLQ